MPIIKIWFGKIDCLKETMLCILFDMYQYSV